MDQLKKATRNTRVLDEIYTKLLLLGEGFFGKVYSGYPKRYPSEKVAIKVIDKSQMQRHELHLHYNEIEVLKVCSDHPCILKLIDYFEDA
jgi:serine/threonine protein kinase